MEAWRPIQQGNLAKSGIEIVDKLCAKYSKTPSQIAINWLIAQKNVVTLTKTSNLDHLAESLGALNWQMSDEDVKLLITDYPIQLDRSNAVQLK
jgi:diketogulonate reductase-like aldo/keto reductase